MLSDVKSDFITKVESLITDENNKSKVIHDGHTLVQMRQSPTDRKTFHDNMVGKFTACVINCEVSKDAKQNVYMLCLTNTMNKA